MNSNINDLRGDLTITVSVPHKIGETFTVTLEESDYLRGLFEAYEMVQHKIREKKWGNKSLMVTIKKGDKIVDTYYHIFRKD